MAENTTPRISVNKLGEYIVSRGRRQREILRDQKFTTTFKGMYHREAAEAISTCIASNLENVAVLERTIRRLEQMHPEKIGTQRRIASNIDALEAFLVMLDDIDLMGATPELGAHRPDRLVLQNVEVSVRPEIVLRGMGRSKTPLIGGIKLHFPRSHPHNDDSAGYVSAVIQEYCKSILAGNEDVFGPYCFVIDVASQTVFPGVRATTNRMKDVVAECRNIKGLWPTITEDD